MKTLFSRWKSVILLVAVALGASASAQQPVAPPVEQIPESPAFEVASLRMRAGGGGLVISPYGTGRWSASALTLRQLLPFAFDLRLSVLPIVGLPDWATRESYSIAAKAEDGVIISRETLRPRLKLLLEERFKLVTHIETRNFKGYALVVARDGHKLKTATDPRAKPTDPLPKSQISSTYLRNKSGAMANLAGSLEALLNLETRDGLAVIDETGLTGFYDVSLSFAPITGVVTDSPLPSLFTALEEQLGLRLISRDRILFRFWSSTMSDIPSWTEE